MRGHSKIAVSVCTMGLAVLALTHPSTATAARQLSPVASTPTSLESEADLWIGYRASAGDISTPVVTRDQIASLAQDDLRVREEQGFPVSREHVLRLYEQAIGLPLSAVRFDGFLMSTNEHAELDYRFALMEQAAQLEDKFGSERWFGGAIIDMRSGGLIRVHVTKDAPSSGVLEINRTIPPDRLVIADAPLSLGGMQDLVDALTRDFLLNGRYGVHTVGIDRFSGRVAVRVSTPDQAARVAEAISLEQPDRADAVIVSVVSPMVPMVAPAGGERTWDNNGVCTLAFSVTVSPAQWGYTRGRLSAGHCGAPPDYGNPEDVRWSNNSVLVGPYVRRSWSSPGAGYSDSMLIGAAASDMTTLNGWVNTTSVASIGNGSSTSDDRVNRAVCWYGGTQGTQRCGVVIAINNSTCNGMTRINRREVNSGFVAGGDSGAPVYSWYNQPNFPLGEGAGIISCGNGITSDYTALKWAMDAQVTTLWTG